MRYSIRKKYHQGGGEGLYINLIERFENITYIKNEYQIIEIPEKKLSSDVFQLGGEKDDPF